MLRMQYGYIGSMRVTDGHRDDVVAILTSGADGLRAAGCRVYAVGVSAADQNMIWVTEIWASKEHHDASLRLPEARAAIASVKPMLTGEYTAQELDIAGGLGV
jgi:quinol monooxygenase YgiN